jgi:predicted Zn-dependent peptidase
MNKKVLGNGVVLLHVANNGQAGFELSLTFKCGHQNEPKLGLAALYENLVLRQAQGGLSAIYGGNLTSFQTSGPLSALNKKFNELWLCCLHPTIDADTVTIAADDIIKHTNDLAGIPLRQTKLAYKHTAFGQDDVVWDTAEYIKHVSSLTAEDVKEYVDTCFVGHNLVIGYSGSESGFAKVVKLADKLFGVLPAGKPSAVKSWFYTGGYQEIPGNGTVQIAMFGWDISRSGNFAETNVLMSMLSARLERALAPLSATSEVKIAGYFGFRTLRISVACYNRKNFDKVLDEVCHQVHRLRNEQASDRRLETSKQRAMAERLAVSNELLPRSVHAAYLFLKRGIDYDNNRCVENISRTDAYDVMDKARDIFTPEMTCVIYGGKASYEELLKKML